MHAREPVGFGRWSRSGSHRDRPARTPSSGRARATLPPPRPAGAHERFRLRLCAEAGFDEAGQGKDRGCNCRLIESCGRLIVSLVSSRTPMLVTSSETGAQRSYGGLLARVRAEYRSISDCSWHCIPPRHGEIATPNVPWPSPSRPMKARNVSQRSARVRLQTLPWSWRHKKSPPIQGCVVPGEEELECRAVARCRKGTPGDRFAPRPRASVRLYPESAPALARRGHSDAAPRGEQPAAVTQAHTAARRVHVDVGGHPATASLEQPFDIGPDQCGHGLVDGRALFSMGDGHRAGGRRLGVGRRRRVQHVGALQAGRGQGPADAGRAVERMSDLPRLPSAGAAHRCR
jgi:hypothetical protein